MYCAFYINLTKPHSHFLCLQRTSPVQRCAQRHRWHASRSDRWTGCYAARWSRGMKHLSQRPLLPDFLCVSQFLVPFWLCVPDTNSGLWTVLCFGARGNFAMIIEQYSLLPLCEFSLSWCSSDKIMFICLFGIVNLSHIPWKQRGWRFWCSDMKQMEC